jgi:hypothetical protein
MARIFLKLNDDKSEFLLICSSRCKGGLGHPISIRIGDQTIDAVPLARNIGALIDQHLTLGPQVRAVCKSSYYHLHNIGLIRKLLTPEATATLVNALVTSKLDGLNALLFGLPKQRSVAPLLQRVQNAAARVIARVGRYNHITPVLCELHWLPVSSRIEFKILLLVYKCVHGLAPVYLKNILTLYKPHRYLRSASGLLLEEPRCRLVTCGDMAFACAAPRLWNKKLRSSQSLLAFKKNLKTFLFTQLDSKPSH